MNPGSDVLNGRVVLVVEDEAIVSMMLADLLVGRLRGDWSGRDHVRTAADTGVPAVIPTSMSKDQIQKKPFGPCS
jgi:hypothetical protein